MVWVYRKPVEEKRDRSGVKVVKKVEKAEIRKEESRVRLGSEVRVSREKLLKVLNTLNNIVVGHEDIHKALLLGLISKEHVVIIAPPGTAKTYTVYLLSKLINANFYKYLLTKFTDYSELFGPVDINALVTGKYVRRWSKIVSAEIVFLDEVFKANSAILNSLLSMLQERVIYDPMSGEPQKVSLWTCIGASNEVPSDEELQALYDRFSIRVFTNYLSDDTMLLKGIESKWIYMYNISSLATMNDVNILHNYATSLIASEVEQFGSPIYKLYHINAIPLIKSLRSRGVIVSDRTVIEKLPKLFGAYLALFGVTTDNIMNCIFDLLPYLARDRSELKDINEVIKNSLGEVGELSNKLEQAKKMVREGDLRGALSMLKEVLNYDVEKLSEKPWLKPRAEAILRAAGEYYKGVEEQLKVLEKIVEG